ncbi:MAG: phosphatidylserine decarboxylase [Alcanivoracaceae bacterium]|nr:phosphatidylserine decarboxylase [Alcanivoracaceae bacterium]
MNDLLEKLFALLQLILPHHLLSRLVGYLARSEVPFVKNNFIKVFLNRFDINMSEAAQEDPYAYDNFNAFFTRALKDGARPIDADAHSIVSPADGAISQLGPILGSDVLQAKGRHYSLYELLGGDSALAAEFTNGSFATVYLSPKDYHRVHMPFTGTLREMIYVPGRLFSVNQATTRQIADLFARNERAVCVFDTEHGPMVVILVGAMIVAGIETVFSGPVTPLARSVQRTCYALDNKGPIVLNKGDELGRFYLGSTAILLFPEGKASFNPSLAADSPVRMGEKLGTFGA